LVGDHSIVDGDDVQIIAAALLHDFKECLGVEIMQVAHDEAIKVLDRLTLSH
jgi:predicted HD phosphohydrolase